MSAQQLELYPAQPSTEEEIIDAEVIDDTPEGVAPVELKTTAGTAVAKRRGPVLLDVARHERTPAQYLETINFAPRTSGPQKISKAAVEAMCDTWPVIRTGERVPSWAPGRLGKAALTYARNDGIDGHWIIRWAKNFPWLAKVYAEAYKDAFGYAPSAKKLAAATFDAYDLMVRSEDDEKAREQEKTGLVLQALRTAAEAGTPFVSSAYDDIVTRGRRRATPGGKPTMGDTMDDVMAWAHAEEQRKAAGQ